MNIKFVLFFVTMTFLVACGLKVVNPNDQNQNQGTMMLDTSGGGLKVVATYTCKLESSGKRHSAIGKTEEEARTEVVAKCKDHTVVSFCDASKVKCVKN